MGYLSYYNVLLSMINIYLWIDKNIHVFIMKDKKFREIGQVYYLLENMEILTSNILIWLQFLQVFLSSPFGIIES